jgi:hypothetical protein
VAMQSGAKIGPVAVSHSDKDDDETCLSRYLASQAHVLFSSSHIS